MCIIYVHVPEISQRSNLQQEMCSVVSGDMGHAWTSKGIAGVSASDIANAIALKLDTLITICAYSPAVHL